MTNQLIGQTIYRQILESRIRNEPFMTNFFKVVGATELVILESGLRFRVKGDKFKGKVVIKLNDMDTYDIEFWKGKTHKGFTTYDKVDEINDIYNDMLLETLWNRVVIV